MRCAGSSTACSGPDEDISLFEYVKRNNRETGPALVGIELGSADGLPSLLRRMAESPLEIEKLDPGFTDLPVPDLIRSSSVRWTA